MLMLIMVDFLLITASCGPGLFAARGQDCWLLPLPPRLPLPTETTGAILSDLLEPHATMCSTLNEPGSLQQSFEYYIRYSPSSFALVAATKQQVPPPQAPLLRHSGACDLPFNKQ